jgi:hypothetical protein
MQTRIAPGRTQQVWVGFASPSACQPTASRIAMFVDVAASTSRALFLTVLQ